MARRNNNHWFDNIINGHFQIPIRSNRRTTTVRNNPPLIIGNGILDQINNFFDVVNNEETLTL